MNSRSGFEITEQSGKTVVVIRNGQGDTATAVLPGGLSDDQMISMGARMMREYRSGKRKFPTRGTEQIAPPLSDKQIQSMSAKQLAEALDDA